MSVEQLVYIAFLIGLLSAASLPLGALTTLIWRPGDRAIAWLMAFGAGALLSAVTIDLFAPAIHNGYFLASAVGAIIGSLFYLFLNHQLNEKGGFLRKTATTIQYFRNRHKKRRQRLQNSLDNLPFFKELPDHEQELFLEELQSEYYSENDILYHHSDNKDAFYIIEHGEVKLRDPDLGLKTFRELSHGEAFGRMAFFTSLRNATLAQAATDLMVWKLDRQTFNTILSKTDTLPEILVNYVQHDAELRNYLLNRHRMSEAQADSHLQAICDSILQNRCLPEPESMQIDIDQAWNRLMHSRRFELFEHCDASLKELIADKLEFRTLYAGQTIFSNRSKADSLYLLESGEVELIDPNLQRFGFEILKPGDFFGTKAFVVGGMHSSSAIAKTDIQFWVLNKSDFLYLLGHLDPLYTHLKNYLKTSDIKQYLVQEQKLPESKAQDWLKRSLTRLLPGQLPSLEALSHSFRQHKAAYLAIWLGIMLDGIPESLMIGAHMTDGHMISMSLIAGLFLSNYPEALSSSASMREQGISFNKVFSAWFFLMVMTGIGAALGSLLLNGANVISFAVISGMAAGAMLTVIAETMLPEAYLKGGSIIGFVTLIGFLSAVLFKALDQG